MYCTLADLLTQIRKEVLLRVAGDDEGNFIPEVIDNGINQAQSEIDAYCRARYKVPFSSPPDMVHKLAIDMAIFHIFSGHGFNFASDSADRIILVRYEKAIDFLKQVSTDKIDLMAGSSTSTTDENGIGTGNLRIKSQERIFSRDRMGAF